MKLERVTLDNSLLPQEIYKGAKYFVTNLALFLSSEVREEIGRLLAELLRAAGVSAEGTFFRVDAYIDPEMRHLDIIEVNSHFVDGWGVALNLAHAFGRGLKINRGDFPKLWTLVDEVYRPEIELACQELTFLTGEEHRVISWQEALVSVEPVYWYGRFRREGFDHVCPKHGASLDDKIWLAKVSQGWEADKVRIPRCYSVEDASWESLPADVVLKVRRKWENERAKPVFKASLLNGGGTRKAYNRGDLIAQEVVPTAHVDGRPIQAVIMCAGVQPIGGYIQHAHRPTQFINDNSEHGLLLFGG